MRKLIWGTLIVTLMFSVLGGACARPGPVLAPAPAPAPTPTPTPVPMPTPVLTNSESDSRVAELEAKIRQLEAENQRLRSENEQLSGENKRLRTESEQLSSDLTKVNSVLRNLHSLATSSSYTNTISTLDDVQTKASELAYFVEGLPYLPPMPVELDFSQINDAIIDARDLRRILRDLPALPPPGWPPFLPFPQELVELDKMRQTFIGMTEWMENLQDLPGFLESAESLEELRSRVEGYLGHVQNTSSDAKDMLEKVRDAASP